MNAFRFGIPALAISFLGGCVIGPSVRSFPPGGTQVTVVTYDLQSVRGELIAVDSADMILVSASDQATDQLVRIAFSDVRRAQAKLGPRWGGKAPDSTQMARLRLLSRFPQGLSGDLLSKVLHAYGQDSVWRLR